VTVLPILTLALVAHQAPAVEPVVWHDDFLQASTAAKEQRKDLFVHFRADASLDAALDGPTVRQRLANFVCVRLPMDYVYKGERMISRWCFSDMMGRPGVCVVSRHDESLPTHDTVISAHPQAGSRYRWAPGLGAHELCVILDLPAHATLSQRSMVYAVSVHPERPRSVLGFAHPGFLGHAARHSARQASLRSQHHANLMAAIGQIQGQTGEYLRGGSEIVAESWGGEGLMEACYSCVDAWRHSAGHWGSLSRQRRYYGYDIAQGPNGVWYATGIFTD
jgi:hypothetical protein